MTDFGKDFPRRGEQPQQAKTPQEELQDLWRQRMFWNTGSEVPLVGGLPESMRLVMVDTNFMVLRSPIPGVPFDKETGKAMDVPIAVFGANLAPEEIKKTADEFSEKVAEGKVWYVPLEELITKNNG